MIQMIKTFVVEYVVILSSSQTIYIYSHVTAQIQQWNTTMPHTKKTSPRKKQAADRERKRKQAAQKANRKVHYPNISIID